MTIAIRLNSRQFLNIHFSNYRRRRLLFCLLYTLGLATIKVQFLRLRKARHSSGLRTEVKSENIL
jgi:hypothetical protein